MKNVNFNNKKFFLVENSENGTVNSETVFEYKQEGNLVTAIYYGGNITNGNIIAVLKDNQLEMLYHCLTIENQLKAGKAIADISITKNNKIKLSLNWQWLNDDQNKGVSEYIES